MTLANFANFVIGKMSLRPVRLTVTASAFPSHMVDFLGGDHFRASALRDSIAADGRWQHQASFFLALAFMTGLEASVIRCVSM